MQTHDDELKTIRKELARLESDFSKLRELAERLLKAMHIKSLHRDPSIANQVTRLRQFLKD